MNTTASPSIVDALALLDALPAPVFVVQRGRFVYVNPAFADVMGLEPRDLVGRESLERVHPDDRDIIPRAAAATEAHRPAATSQLRVRRGDGAERSLVVTTVVAPYLGRNAVLGTITDVTMQPDAVNISVRMAALGRLAGGIAHDFNNLLLVMGGEIERLDGGLGPGHTLRPSVDAIAAAADRAAVLTDKLLSFGRRQMLAPQVLDLGGFLAELNPQLRSRAGAEVRLSLSLDRDLPPVRADRPRLREVLWHLVDNARDAMPDGGTLTIAVDRAVIDADLKARWSFLALGGVFVRLRVIDSGRGMDEGVLPHVFEPFFTTKGRGRGAGMGLSSVYGIVKQSAGYVFVERTGADGTCVTILLPPAEAGDHAASAAIPAAVGGAAAARPRILLVEDDMAVRELLGDVLSAQGFEVASAETAEQAELIGRSERFDLLLSDVDLPGMSGAQLAAALRARTPALRVILISGYPDDGAIAEAGLHERPRLLRKPFSTRTLIDQVREVLEPRDE